MKVKFSPNTKDDFRNYKEYLEELKKSDTGKYSHIKPENEKKKLRDDIGSSIGDKGEHSDSIFPKEFDYSSDSHKMYIDKKSHQVVFYKVIKPKKGESYVSIEKCIHSTELKKELDKKGIEPLEDGDPKLFLYICTKTTSTQTKKSFPIPKSSSLFRALNPYASGAIASDGQTPAQVPQSMHLSASIT